MPARDQHYVPRVYLKAWESMVETAKEPNKKFNGVYCFKNGSILGEGRTRESILYTPHLYTVNFTQLYMARKCPKIYSFFANEIHKKMQENKPKPVYGKYGYSVIKTARSVSKHLNEINDWNFYYIDGTIARKKAILNSFNDLNCYLLEDSFGERFEASWENVLNSFIQETRDAQPNPRKSGIRSISTQTAVDMLEFFFMMLCRNPQFDSMGIYTWMKDLLKSTFVGADEAEKLESIQAIDDMMEDVWLSDLYKMFYKKNGGFYNTALSKSLEKCQIILFEAYSNACSFITSDNPAFQYVSFVEVHNRNGFYFPISPKYLLLICRGDEPINYIDYRIANEDLVRSFNRVIASQCRELIVSNEKSRSAIL